MAANEFNRLGHELDILITSIREGNLERSSELINFLGLTNSITWFDGYVFLREAFNINHMEMAKLILMNINNKIDSKALARRPSERDALIDLEIGQIDKLAILEAIINGDVEILEMLLDKYEDNRDLYYMPLLHLAIQSDKIAIVELLVNRGAEVNFASEGFEGMTSLHHAVWLCSVEIVATLLAHNADVKVVDKYGRTPLHRCGCVAIGKMLLANGANVNAKCKRGATALYLASQNGNSRMAKLLLIHGAEMNGRDEQGMTPLHVAVRSGSVAIVETLLAHNAEINALNAYGWTPLHGCDSDAIGMLLLANDAEVNAKSECKVTALHVASHRGNPRMVKLLLMHGADIHATDVQGMTPLHQASACNPDQPQTIKELLRFGSDINAIDKNGRTPFSDIIGTYRRFSAQNISVKQVIENIKIFKQEIIKRRIANFYVCKQNLELFDQVKTKMGPFEASCKREIVEMRQTKIGGNISFYEALSKDIHDISIYAKYTTFVETLESETWRETFPIYCDLIWNRFKTAQKRESLLDRSVSSFNFLIGREFLDVLTMDIFRYLSNEDLENLIKARLTN